MFKIACFATLAIWGLISLHPAFADEGGAAPKLRLWSKQAADSWWADRLKPADWIVGAEDLHRSLLDAQARHGVERALRNDHFMAWMMLRRWISLLPPDYQNHPYFGEDRHLELFRGLGTKHELIEMVCGTLLPEDDGAAVAEILCRIAAAHGDDFDEYIKLAVAMAVVGDSAPPDGWPHPYVAREAIPVGDDDPGVRFGFLVDAHREGKLLLDPRELSVRELCFVVDTPVELRELQYAQQIDIREPGRLEQLYFAVKYDDGRIQRQRYQWPHGSYRLIDIGKRGGICADQAYFVSHAGKAKGVPTVVFVGQGLSGNHAWVGFLEGRGRWEFEAARVRSEKYPVGIAYDPQTWKRVTDAQMAALNKEIGGGRGIEVSRRMLQWAALNPSDPSSREVISLARKVMPRSIEAWEMESTWLERHEPDLKIHVAFWQDWVRTFDRESDLKIRGQKSLLRTLERLGDEREAERLRERVIAENRSSRFDLGISLAADDVFAKLTERDWAAAQKAYESVMRRFKRKAGGHLFYNLVQPYVSTCLQEGQREMAQSAVEDLLRDFDAKAGSILDNDLRQLIATVEGAG